LKIKKKELACETKMLSHCYVTRDPSGFAARMSTDLGLSFDQVTMAVEDARALHQETHLALEFVSELACRAMVCHCLKLDETEFMQVLTRVCDVSNEHTRLTHALRAAGVPLRYWEDVVVHAGRVASR
jgi:hypothetical protein